MTDRIMGKMKYPAFKTEDGAEISSFFGPHPAGIPSHCSKVRPADGNKAMLTAKSPMGQGENSQEIYQKAAT